MGNLAKPIAESLKFTDFIMNLVTGDLKNEDAVRRARGAEGASIAWIVGHLCYGRYILLNLLGAEEENPYADVFGRAGASDGSDYPDISELRRSWNETAEKVRGAMESATDEQLMSHPATPDSPHGEKVLLDTIVFWMWHESYHMGQLGTIRTQLGYPSTSELAVGAS